MKKKDFGNVAKKGTFEKDAAQKIHSSYEEYCKTKNFKFKN